MEAGDARRNLVKAGALVLAEIERLDRAEAGKNCADVADEVAAEYRCDESPKSED